MCLPSAAGKDLANDLLWIQLPPLQVYEQKKQTAAKIRHSQATGNEINPKRNQRCIESAKGNPGLQDLLLRMSLKTPDQCDQALDEMTTYLEKGATPQHQKLLDLFENLAMDKLMAALTPGEKELLRSTTLFSIPVPLQVMELAAREAVLDGGYPC